MKKLILAAFVAVASLTASAQWWVGGEVGFNATKTTGLGASVKGNQFVVAPEIGYKVNDKIDVAVLVGYAHAKNNELFDYDDVFENGNGFEINPYVRYSFIQAGNFKFFVDGGFAYGLLHESGEKSVNVWEIAVKPGIAYSLSDKVSLVAHVGSAGWQFAKQGDVKTNSWGCGVSGNNITFGAYVNL